MRTRKSNLVVALTIAGADPGGGAGVQADLKTFAALGVYGYSVLTEIVAQNSTTVFELAPLEPAIVAAQIEALAAERKPDALKTGALATAAIVATVASAITTHGFAAPVVDPVLVSSSGSRLLDEEGERALLAQLIPLARIVTPNIPEAQMLTGVKIDGARAMREAARRLVRCGAAAAVVKGGHLAPTSEPIDLFYDGRKFVTLTAPRIKVEGAHGTGCAFSAAIAAYLARGRDLEAAVRGAKRFVTAALRRSFVLGAGRPLLDHFSAR